MRRMWKNFKGYTFMSPIKMGFLKQIVSYNLTIIKPSHQIFIFSEFLKSSFLLSLFIKFLVFTFRTLTLNAVNKFCIPVSLLLLLKAERVQTDYKQKFHACNIYLKPLKFIKI